MPRCALGLATKNWIYTVDNPIFEFAVNLSHRLGLYAGSRMNIFFENIACRYKHSLMHWNRYFYPPVLHRQVTSSHGLYQQYDSYKK